MTMTTANDEIRTLIDANDVVLFMKGTASAPQCGFSKTVAGILSYMEVPFRDVNVLEDDAIRQGVKEVSDWPTIPQLYIKGEFVGGCDIIKEITLSGELERPAWPIPATPPSRSGNITARPTAPP